MPYRPIVMSTQIHADPKSAAKELLEAFRKHRGDRSAIAQEYDVEIGTLRRWLNRLAERGHDLRPRIAKIR